MKTWVLGALSALAASACCLGPVVLGLLGLGSLGIAATLGRYHAWFTGLAVALLATGWQRYVKERRRCHSQQCQMAQRRLTKWTLVASSAAVAIFALGG